MAGYQKKENPPPSQTEEGLATAVDVICPRRPCLLTGDQMHAVQPMFQQEILRGGGSPERKGGQCKGSDKPLRTLTNCAEANLPMQAHKQVSSGPSGGPCLGGNCLNPLPHQLFYGSFSCLNRWNRRKLDPVHPCTLLQFAIREFGIFGGEKSSPKLRDKTSRHLFPWFFRDFVPLLWNCMYLHSGTLAFLWILWESGGQTWAVSGPSWSATPPRPASPHG